MSPSVGLQFGFAGPFLLSSDDDLDLVLEDLGVTERVHLTGMSSSSKGRITGRFARQVQFCRPGAGDHTNQSLVRVMFHVVNMFPYYGSPLHVRYPDGSTMNWLGRASCEFGGWVVRLDELPPERPARHARLEASGGHGVTNIGCLARADGATFSPDDADEALKFLYWFLGFVNGALASIVLVRGLDAEGQVIWENWTPTKVRPFASQTSWLPEQHVNDALGIVERCYSFWCDPKKRHWFTLAVSLYSGCTRNYDGTEMQLAKCCIVLEMLTSVVLREERGIYSQTALNNLGGAADRLRRLLAECGIPASIPPKFAELAAEYPGMDGPGAVVDMRNCLVHLKESNRLELLARNANARFQAWYLSLWYVEMVLLNLFDYTGLYQNRLDLRRWAGTYEKVPWAT
jgi:hypothetical protein